MRGACLPCHWTTLASVPNAEKRLGRVSDSIRKSINGLDNICLIIYCLVMNKRERDTAQVELGFWVGSLSSAMKNSLNRSLAPFDITASQWAILETCYKGEADSVSTLCRYIPVDAAAISRQVDRLVSKRLIQRRRRAKDRRTVRITLTAAGRELVPKLAPLIHANNDQFLKRLDSTEQLNLARMLQKILDNNGIRQEGI